MALHADGTSFYGMQIEAVMDRIKDNIDHLSRLLVDVQMDSSKLWTRSFRTTSEC